MSTASNTWPRLLRRLYLLALGSVVLSVGATLLFARAMPPPPSPGILRSALLHLADVVEDPAARVAEIERLKSDAGLPITVYDARAHFIVANVDPPLPFVPPRGDPFDHGPHDPHGPPPPPFDHGPPPPFDHGPPPFDHGHGPHFDDGGPPHDRDHGPPPPPGVPFGGALFGDDHDHGPGHDGNIALPLTAPSGAPYVAVVGAPGLGEMKKLALLIGVVLVLLAAVAVPFAVTLARPLGELARATQSFGAGDVQARANLQRAGAFSDLAAAFNEMAERVSASVRAERELLANVSHELRTPLARIRVALDLAAEGDAALARESLVDIEGDLGELERLVDDILTAARLEATGESGVVGFGGARLKKVPTALAPLLDEAARRFRTRHPQHVLAVDAAADLPELDVDPVLLRRAFDNFLDNAGKYSEPGSDVALSARAEHGEIAVVVEDHGIGVAPDDQARLFTPFFRAEKSRARSKGGVGLGLALSKRIVEAHGGSVSLASEPGRGTAVTVRLPIVHA